MAPARRGRGAGGRAVRAELGQAGHDVALADGLDAASGAVSYALCRGYERQARTRPGLLAPMSSLTRWSGGAWAVRRSAGLLFADRLLRDVRAEHPDLVVSTYPLVTAALGRRRTDGGLGIPVAAVIADYGVHPLWVDPRVDLHLVPSPLSAELASEAGGTARVARMPVEPAFRSGPSRARARAALGIPRGTYVALVVGGALGLGDLEGATAHAARAGTRYS